MMFDNDFSKCVTVSQCDEAYKSLEAITPIESRVFLKRAYNKRSEDIEAEQKTESLRRGYLESQEKARKENRKNIRFGQFFDSVSHHAVAEAVADSLNPFYMARPRLWLSKHRGAAGNQPVVPPELKQLLRDFKETVKEFENMVKAKNFYRENPDGEDTRYNVAL